MKNKVIRKAIKNLANAPALALAKTLEELTDPTDRDDAKRLFEAVGVKPTKGGGNE